MFSKAQEIHSKLVYVLMDFLIDLKLDDLHTWHSLSNQGQGKCEKLLSIASLESQEYFSKIAMPFLIFSLSTFIYLILFFLYV